MSSPDASGRSSRTVRCERCGQRCVLDAAWTVRGRGACCRIDGPESVEDSAKRIMAARIMREGPGR